MRRAAWCVTLVLLALPPTARAADQSPLARARVAYNAANYDAAIAAANDARTQPGSADAAGVVLARSYLERYRSSASPADLNAARDALRGIVRARLNARDQLDLLVALGQTLFLADAFGPGAEIFETAVSRASMLSPGERSRLLDWWATAMERVAQSRPPERRARVFERIATRMEQELLKNPWSVPANYWLAASIRGTGDVDRAWDAAVAGWVRVSADPDVAATVRGDLDKLVTQALIPERARQHPAREQAEAVTALRSQWESVKSQWP